jgi:serine/threonine protein kinase
MRCLQDKCINIASKSQHDKKSLACCESNNGEEIGQCFTVDLLESAIAEANDDLVHATTIQCTIKSKIAIAQERLVQLKVKHQTIQHDRHMKMHDIFFKQIPGYNNYRAIPPISDETSETEDQVGVYKICNCIAEGGFAKVFRARHELQGTYHAIKRLDKRQFKSIKDLAQLGREIQVLKSEIHDNVTECSEVIHTRRYIYVVMDLSFSDLHTYCQLWRSDMTDSVFRTIATGILQGLECLHHIGIAHLDMKPENILVSRDIPPGMLCSKHFKICDLGLCAISAVPNSAIKVDHMLGTAGFISPELVLLQDGSCVEGRSCDIWSVGVLLLELLEGVSEKWFKIYHEQREKRDDRAFAMQLLHELVVIQNCIHDDNSGQDLIRRMLQWEPESRISAKQALEHPWLSDVSTIHE